MAELTQGAERIWQGFLSEVRDLAAHRGIDEDDLVISLDEHLDELGQETMLDAEEVSVLIEELRSEIADEAGTGEAAVQPESWRASLISMGLFLVSILTFPFIGPVLAIPSWITSRMLANSEHKHYPLIIFPAVFYAALSLLTVILLSAYLPAVLGMETGWIGRAWAAAVATSLGIAITGLVLLALQFHTGIFALAIYPLNTFFRGLVPLRICKLLVVIGCVATIASVIGGVRAS